MSLQRACNSSCELQTFPFNYLRCQHKPSTTLVFTISLLVTAPGKENRTFYSKGLHLCFLKWRKGSEMTESTEDINWLHLEADCKTSQKPALNIWEALPWPVTVLKSPPKHPRGYRHNTCGQLSPQHAKHRVTEAAWDKTRTV